MLFPHLAASPDAESKVNGEIRIRDRALSFPALTLAALDATSAVEAGERVAVIAHRDLDSIIAIVGLLLRGAVVIPINPGATFRELEHVQRDAAPSHLFISDAGAEARDANSGDGRVPDPFGDLATTVVSSSDASDRAGAALSGASSSVATAREVRRSLPPIPDDAAALIMYTSGTTGPPKGAVLSRRAVAANLDMLAEAWAWTTEDVLVQALPLYHVHGLVLGVLGPIHVGSGLIHLGDFDPQSTALALRGGATMHFGVPTIYHRLANCAEQDPQLAADLARARLLVSGSAGLPLSVHERIRRLTGHTIVERYGMTETLITTAVPAGLADKPGTVGPALRGVNLRVVDDSGIDVARDGSSMGEILVRSPALFDEYLSKPEATSAAFRDGWFVTGDTATVDAEGYLRIVGRTSIDIIKSGGYKIGAGEIEDALLEHPGVAEVAVRGIADPEWGEIVAAWVVAQPGQTGLAEALAEHADRVLARHKQPRAIFIVAHLPRNAMGKVHKSQLEAPSPRAVSGPRRRHTPRMALMPSPPLPREQFPVAERYCYLNHAGIGPLSLAAGEVGHAFLDDFVRRGAVGFRTWDTRMEQVRSSAARLMGVPSDDVAFVKNTTEGLSFVANGLRWNPGDRVIVPDLEFPSTIYPWLSLREFGVRVDLVTPVGEGRTLPLELFEAALASAPTALVAVSWVQFGRGWRTDLAALGALCREYGALLCVDAIQGLGVIPAQFEAWGVDFAAADAHKWMVGPLGTGILYVAERARDRLRPLEPGWASVAHREEWDNLELVYAKSARRFEGGSHTLETISQMGASIDLLLEAGVDTIFEHVSALLDYTVTGVIEIGGRVLSDLSEDGRSGHITVVLPGHDADAIFDRLDQQRIVCAARGGGVRIAPHGYNTMSDIDVLIHALARISRD